LCGGYFMEFPYFIRLCQVAHKSARDSDEEIVPPISGIGKQRLLCGTLCEASQKGFFWRAGVFLPTAPGRRTQPKKLSFAPTRYPHLSGWKFFWVGSCGSAKNVCIDQWRKRRPEAGLDSELLPEGAAVGAMDRTPDLRLMVEEVWKEMASLPLDQRRCVEMKSRLFLWSVSEKSNRQPRINNLQTVLSL